MSFVDQNQLNTNNVTELDQNVGDEEVVNIGFGRILTCTLMLLVTCVQGTLLKDFEETFSFYYVHQYNHMTRTKKPTLKIRRHEVYRAHIELDWFFFTLVVQI